MPRSRKQLAAFYLLFRGSICHGQQNIDNAWVTCGLGHRFNIHWGEETLGFVPWAQLERGLQGGGGRGRGKLAYKKEPTVMKGIGGQRRNGASACKTNLFHCSLS